MVEAAIATHRDWIAGEVLATDDRVGGAPEGDGTMLARQRWTSMGSARDLALTKDE